MHSETAPQTLAEALRHLGARQAFGITGGGIARFTAACAQAGLQVVHTRHEAGAAFMAAEAYFASGRPSVLYTTTGPGYTNALTGLIAAAWEGAKVIVVTGGTRRDRLGQGAFQETGPGLLERPVCFPPSVRYHTAALHHEALIGTYVERLASELAQPGGLIANIMLPADLQMTPSTPSRRADRAAQVPRCDEQTIERVAGLLNAGSFVVWAGFGARHASEQVRALIDRTGAPLMASPRAKGCLPEDHPRYLGVSGFGGHASVLDYLSAHQPDFTLVLGSRLSEFTSYWSPVYEPYAGFVQVDIDPMAFSQAYPEAETLGVVSDVGAFLEMILPHLDPTEAPAPTRAPRFAPALEVRDDARGVHPAALMAAVQRVVIDGSDALVMTEAGNAFAWGSRALRFSQARRYRVSTSFGAMGQASTGVVGAAIGRRGKAVALVGDGAMLMNNEISTAVQYGADAVWIVLNDASYGMIHHGMQAIGLEPVETVIPTTDFALFARAQGARGLRVDALDALEGALEEAMRARGPVVVDVRIDPTVAPPFDGRNANLRLDDQEETAWRG